jgi:pre-rRNA-processing protein TSR1
MSAYQADWYVDEDGKGNFDEEDDEDEEGGERMKVPDDASVLADFENDDDDSASMMEGSVANTVSFAQNTLQSADAALIEKRRLRTLAQAKDDKEFPDELDTPADVTARLRFARYRALQSFRSSPWHPKENLPTDYSRIFQFENFSSAQRRYLLIYYFLSSV